MKITDVPYSDPSKQRNYRSYKLQFQAPQTVGFYTWKVYLVSDTFVGEEIVRDVVVRVDELLRVAAFRRIGSPAAGSECSNEMPYCGVGDGLGTCCSTIAVNNTSLREPFHVNPVEACRGGGVYFARFRKERSNWCQCQRISLGI